MAKKKAAQNSGRAAGEQPISVLRPDAKNARRISEEGLSGLRVSVDEFGDLSGITWNEKLDALVCGHQRMTVLRDAGVKTWKRIDKTQGEIVHPSTGERFPVRIVQWDEAKHRLAQIAANNPHIQGEFTEETLEQLRALENEVSYAELKLNALADQLASEVSTWDSDIEQIEGSGSHTQGIDAKITVTCPQERKDELLGIIQKAVTESGIPEVSVA